MKQVFVKVALATLVIGMASAAMAAAPSWSYVEAGYLNVDPDDADSAGDNWFAGGNFALGKNFHIGARYVDGDFGDFSDELGVETSVDFSYWTFAFGWHGLLGEKWDLFAEAAWNDIEVGDTSDDAVGVNAGIKWRPVDLFEADGVVKWADYEDSTTTYGLIGIFHFGRFGLGASAEFSDDATQYTAFARFAFDAK